MKVLRGIFLVIILNIVLLGNSRAEVDWSTLKDSTHYSTRRQTIDFNLLFGFLFGSYSHIGVASWYGYPIVPDGFISNINDALFIEAGVAVERFNYTFAACDEKWWRISPMGGVRYQFYLTDNWTLFATGKIGYGSGFSHSSQCNLRKASASQFILDSSIGAYYKLSKDWRMRLEIGYYGLNPGIGMQL